MFGNTQAYRHSSGWTFTVSGLNGHPATDNLRGTDVYGTPAVTSEWSMNFEEAVPGWDEFMFSSGDCNVDRDDQSRGDWRRRDGT